MTRQRVRIGQEVRVVAERTDGLELEGRARLAPGQPVDIVLTPAGASASSVKAAVVWSWSVVRVSGAGATYRGLCRWDGDAAAAGQ